MKRHLDCRLVSIAFADMKVKKAFDKLQRGRGEERELFGFINRAIDDLKKDPYIGIDVPKRLWPKEYARKFGIDNLWKYDLPNGWRLIYTVKGEAVQVVAIVLEWFSHKEYERRFKY